MHLTALCPTYGRPSLAANAAALFLAQTLRDGDTAELVIFDDAGQLQPMELIHPDQTKIVRVIISHRWTRLQLKYPLMASDVSRVSIDQPYAYVIWDDDDVYLPWHLSAIAAALDGGRTIGYAHPSEIWSTYDPDVSKPIKDRLHLESAAGRFHGAAAVTAWALAKSGGWCIEDRADYDQVHLRNWYETAKRGDPCQHFAPSYVYRWADTQRNHCSGSIRDNRYQQPPIQEPGYVGPLLPAFDASTEAIWAALVPSERPRYAYFPIAAAA